MIVDWQRRLNAIGYPVAIDGQAGPATYSAIFAYLGAKANAPILGASAAQHFPTYRVEGARRVSNWLAQFAHESRNFTDFEEDLRYTAGRLCAVWPKRFPSLAAAQPFANNPEALANRVYGNRADLGNHEPGDDWLFRGRGPGLTGRANYAACASRTGLDLVNHPELAADPKNFVLIACDFWAQAGCNPLADINDLRGITKKINGGFVGLDERAALLAKVQQVVV